ncbi:MAG: Flavin prenyltransferase UbiX [Fimbriimonadaceae bacterium]|nr:Flavin prenyltransferase UbiX [Fimbriimonadaceae bacterium]
MSTGKLVVGVTGASGAIYAQRFLQRVTERFEDVYLIMSDQAVQVAATELGVRISKEDFDPGAWLGKPVRNLHLLDDRDYFTPPASGSFRHDGMVIIPCSMGTAGRVANGISNDLLTRCADVCLKERRPLVVVPREMPWNLIMLRNLTALAEAGATILPACPSWYDKPGSLEDLADTVVGRVLRMIGADRGDVHEWMTEA